MQATPTDIDGVVLLEPAVHADERGHFFESWNRVRFAEAIGRDVEFAQDNESRSVAGVVRGLHYQLAPHAQGKLVRCIRGAIWDVAVDIRRSSATFGRWVAAELSASNHRQLWIPEGFAHGFVALTDADVLYKASAPYTPDSDRSIVWDDPELAIDWPLEVAPRLSDKDANAPRLADADTFA